MAALRLFALAAVLCGAVVIVQANRNARIVKGVETPIEKAPFLVQLLFRDEDNPRQMQGTTCAGVIVTDRHVLTAAHCFDRLPKHLAEPKNYLGVIAGASDKYWGRTSGELYEVKSVKLCPGYKVPLAWTKDTGDAKFDLALLEVDRPFRFSNNIKPVEITKTRVAGGTQVSVGGWGFNTTSLSEDYMKDFHPSLYVAQQEIQSHSDCFKYLQRIRLTAGARESLLCTTNLNGNSCQGDSGSGLWIEPKDGEPAILVGLVQGGVACDLHHPSLYVDLADPEIQEFLIKNGALAQRKEISQWSEVTTSTSQEVLGAKAPLGRPIAQSNLPKELQGIPGLEAFSFSGEDGFFSGKPMAQNDLPEELRNIPGLQAFTW